MSFVAAALPAAEPVKMTEREDKQILEGFLKNADKVPSVLNPAYCKKIAAEEGRELPRGSSSRSWRCRWPPTSSPAKRSTWTPSSKPSRTCGARSPRGRTARSTGTASRWITSRTHDKDKKLPVMLNAFHTADVVGRFLEAVAKGPALTQKYAKEANRVPGPDRE